MQLAMGNVSVSLPHIFVFIGGMMTVGGAFWAWTKKEKAVPHIIIFIGGLVTITGAFWASIQQSSFETEMREKTNSAIDSIIGGDSYVWVDANILDGNLFRPVFIHRGEHPMYDVGGRIVNVTSLPYIEVPFEVGNIALGRGKFNLNETIALSGTGLHLFNIFTHARNIAVVELLRLRNVNGQWKRAIRVYKQPEGGILFEQVDPDYPNPEQDFKNDGPTIP